MPERIREWLNRLSAKLRRPKVGATGALKSLSASRGEHAWHVRVLGYASWLLLALVFLVTYLPLPKQTPLDRWKIAYVLAAYGVYVFALELSSRRFPKYYDSASFHLLRIAANVFAVSALIYVSPGAGNYFWSLYALPVFQSYLYLRTRGAVAMTAAVVLVYWLLSLAAGARTDFISVALNTLLLVLLALGLHWLFGAARESRELEFEVMDALRVITLDIAAKMERRELLQTIIVSAVSLLSAKSGGVYEYDPERRELTVVADWSREERRSIFGHRLAVGTGMAGRVVLSGEPMRVENYSTWPERCPALEPGLFRAVVEVPLALPSGPLGVLYVSDDDEKRTFDERDERILSLLASHAAITMSNVGTFERSEEMVIKLALLDRLSAKISRALSLEEILSETLLETLKAVGTEDGSIMVYDPVEELLEIKAWIFDGKPRNGKEHRRFRLREGIAGHVAAERRPHNCGDVRNDPFFVDSEAGRNFRSILSVPIISNEKVVCIINADSRHPNHFKDAHIEILSAIADHVAVAIEAQLLRNLGLSLATDEPERLFAKIVESACTLTGSDVSTIFLRDEETGSIERVAAYPPAEGQNEDRARKDGLTQQVLDGGEPERINDYEGYEGGKPEVKKRGIKTLCAMPLKVRLDDGHETVGVLYASRKEARAFTQRDVQILSVIANLAAIAVKKVRLYLALRRERDALARSNSFKESLVANAFDAIIACDRKGLVVEFNTGAERILGYKREEALGTHVGRFYADPEAAREVKQLLLDEKNNGRLVNYLVDARGENGDIIPIRLSVSLLEDGTVGFFRDRREIVNVRRHLDRVRARRAGGESVPEPEDVQRVAEDIARRALATLHADAVSLYVYDPESEQVRLPAVRLKLRKPEEGGLSVGPGSPVEKLIKEEDIYFTESTPCDRLVGGPFAQREGVCATAAGPLRVMDRTVGVIFINFREPHPRSEEWEQLRRELPPHRVPEPLPFTDEWKKLCREFMDEAAIALEHAQLYEGLGSYAQLLDEMHRVSVGLTAEFTDDRMLNAILEQAMKLTDARYAALSIVGQDRQISKFLFKGMTEEDKERIGEEPKGHGVLGQLLKEDDVIREIDITNNQRFRGFPDGHAPMKSFLGVPIVIKHEPIGNIYLGEKRHANAFSETDVLVLEMLANLAAFVINNFHANEDAGTRQAVTFGFLLLTHWSRDVRRRGIQFAERLSELAGEPGVPPAVADGLLEISKVARALDAPLLTMQEEVRLEMGDLVDLSQELYDLRRELQAEWQVPITVEDVDPACTVRGNGPLLRIAFTTLIENAARAVRDREGAGEIRLRCSVNEGLVRGAVIDDGCGIPEEIKSKLFEEMVSYDPALGPHKKGLGYASLAVGRIMRLHHGHVRVAETRPGSTVIEFSLPTERR
ncbi:MAG: GAF domain-containing protein [Pyrinomonadaceae bacterium]